MRIKQVTATTHAVPVVKPLRTEPVEFSILIVRIETESGAVGIGVGSPFNRVAVQEVINNELGPLIVGADIRNIEHVTNLMHRSFVNGHREGIGQWAISAIDLALWDARGHSIQTPVWRMLGGYRDKVPAYVTYGMLDYDRDELVEAARILVAAGHTRLKMVVGIDGYQNVREDARRVAAVREAVGDTIELMVDANEGFDFVEARELIGRLAPFDVFWFEEPLVGNDWRGLRELRGRAEMPIGAGQFLGRLAEYRDLLTADAVDFVHLNVAQSGGYTGGLKIAALTEAFGLKIGNGAGWPHHNAHLQAAVPNGSRVEFHYLIWKATQQLFNGLLEPVNGWIELPDSPGFGATPNFEALSASLEKSPYLPDRHWLLEARS